MSSQAAIITLLSKIASEQLKKLLEEKHLYQSVSIDPTETATKLIEKETNPNLKQKEQLWFQYTFSKMPFSLAQAQLLAVPRGAAQASASLTLILQNPSLYCAKCKRREAFAPIWYQEVSNEIRVQVAQHLSKQVTLPDSFQMFFLVYQCQRCFGAPEGFLVRRDRWTLGLHGRSPFEDIEVSKSIPSKEQKHYRDAVIAFNAGKILAALFYLRTFIEQFARRVTGKDGRTTGEVLFAEYNKALPLPTKDQMPSLGEWYEKLSDALHSAREDADLFDKAKQEIDQHFEIRRVFKMPEVPPAQPASENTTAPKESNISDNAPSAADGQTQETA